MPLNVLLWLLPLGVAEYPGKSLTESWQRFIFHQFHDDLTGTSIPRAYEFSWNDELLSLKQFSSILTHSVGSVAGKLDTRVKGIPVVLYNASGFKATDVVTIEVEASRFPKVWLYITNKASWWFLSWFHILMERSAC